MVISNGFIICFGRVENLHSNQDVTYQLPLTFNIMPTCIGCYNHNAHSFVLRVWANVTTVRLVPDSWNSIIQSGGRSYIVLGY